MQNTPCRTRARARSVKNGGVVFQRSGGRGEVLLRREDDLIETEPVLADLDADRLRAGRVEVKDGTEHAGAVSVVLPSPTRHARARRVFEIDGRRACGADAEDGRAARVHRVRELDEDGVVAPAIALRPSPHPEAVRAAGFRL